MRRHPGTTSVVIFAVLLISCAKVAKETPPELYWPFPPERPRIKFVDLIVGSIDVTGTKSKLKSLLFGAEREVPFVKPIFVSAKNNTLYVTDFNGIHVYDFNESKFRFLRGFGNATGIAATSEGVLYVGDSVSHAVYKVLLDSRRMIPITAPGTIGSPGGIAVDEKNERLIVPDARMHRIMVYDLEGKFLFKIGKRGNEPGEFNFPYAAAVDGEGRIYISDAGNFRVQILDKDGNFISEFGSVGSSPGNFARPKGIALDSEGHIYVIDAAFGNFQIFDINGNLLLSVGSVGEQPGRFVLPAGITVDENDKIYVVDQMNYRIQIFQYLKYSDGADE